MSDPAIIIHGPVVPTTGGGIIYSVTLGNGYVVTGPRGFGDAEPMAETAPLRPLPPLPLPGPVIATAPVGSLKR